MKNQVGWTLAVVVLCAALLVVPVGCKSGRGRTLETGLVDDTASGLEAGGHEPTIGEGLPEDIDIERLLWSKDTGLKPVYFDYDSYVLRPDALDILKENAEKILSVPNVIIQIEGHCDERGTNEYNIVLGERRALATREHLMRLGVSGDRMITISYGEEDPVDPGHNETAWAKNRRCEFNKAL